MIGRASGSINIEVDEALRNLDRLQGGISNFDRQAATGATGWSQAIKNNEQNLQRVGTGLVALGTAVTGTFGFMVNTAANFEASMDGVAASFGGVDTATGITKEQFAALQDEALRIGETTSKSATESAMAMELMAKAGLDVETVLNGAAQAAVNVSEATGESLEQSASTMSTLSLLFESTGISASDMGDVIVNAMNMSDASMSEFQTGMARLAPAIKGGSLEAQEAAAALVYFNAQGFSAAEVGTSLASIFQSVVAPATDEAATALENAGIQAFNAQGEFIGFPALFDQIATATEGMTEKQKAAFLSTAFMTDGMDLLQTITGDTGEVMRQTEKDIAQTGTAAEASAIRMDNLKGSIEQMMGAFETLSIRLGSALIPFIRPVVDAVTGLIEVVSGLPQPILGAIAIITAFIGVFALVAGGILLALPYLAQVHLVFTRLGGLAGIMARFSSGLASLGALFARFGGFSGILAAGLRLVFVALQRLLFANPILTALSLALLAYQNNFLGFGDAVRSVAGWIADAISSIVSWLGRITGVSQAIDNFRNRWNMLQDTVANNVITRALLSLEGALRGLNQSLDLGWLDSLADKLRGVGDAVHDFWGMFQSQDTTVEATLDVKFEGDDHVIEWQEQPDGSIKYAVMHVEEDGSLTEFGEIIESYDDPDNPNITHIKVRGDDGEFWTTIDNIENQSSGGGIGDATIKVGADKKSIRDTRTQIERIVDGLREMEQTLRDADMDFFADLVDMTADGLEAVGRLTEQFRMFRDLGMDPVEAGLMALGAAFPQLRDVTTQLYGAWQNLLDTGQELADFFNSFRELGINPVSSALLALGATFETLMPLMSSLADAAADVQDAFQAFMDGDWSTGFAEIGSAAQNLWEGLGEGVALIGTLAGAVFDGMQSIGQAIQGWWETEGITYWNTGIEMLRSAGGQIVDWVLDVGIPAVTGWLQTASAGLWNALVAAAGWVWSGVVDLASWTLNVGVPTAYGWLSSLASNVWNGLVAAAGWAWSGVVDLTSWTLNVGVPTAYGWLSSLAGNIWNGLVAAAGWAWSGVVDLTSWTLNVGVPTAYGWLSSLAGNIWNGLVAAAGWAWTGVVDLANWVLQVAAPTAGGWLTTIAEWIETQIRNALASVSITSTDMITVGTQVAQAIGQAIGLGVQGMLDISTDILNEVTSQIEGIDWGGAGNAVGRGLGEAVKAGIMGIGAVAGWGAYLTAEILGQLRSINFDDAETAIGNFMLTAVSGAFEFVGGFVQGFADALFSDIDWSSVAAGFDDVVAAIDAIGTAANGALGPLQLLADALELVQSFGFSTDDQPAPVDESGMPEPVGGEGPTIPTGDDSGLPPPLPPDGLAGNFRRMFLEAVVAIQEGATQVSAALTSSGMQWGTTMATATAALGSVAMTGFGQIPLAAGPPLMQVGTVLGTSAMQWGTVLATAGASLGMAATTAFGSIPLAATPPMLSTSMMVATQTGAMLASTVLNFGGMVASAMTQFPAMATAGTSAANTMRTGVTSAINTMRSTSTVAVAGMQAGIAASMTVMQSAASSAASTMRSNVVSQSTTMSTSSAAQVRGMQAGIAASMLLMRNSATSNAQTMATNVVNAARLMGTGAANAVRSGMSQIPGIIASVGAMAASVAFAVGAQIGNGVASGMESALGRVRAAASAIVSEAAGAMAAAAMISSPSRLFQLLARYIPLGVALGIEDETPDVARAAVGMVDAALSPAEDMQNTWAALMASTVPMPFGGGMVLDGAGGAAGTMMTVYMDIDVSSPDPAEAGTSVIRELRREFALGGGLMGGK